MSVFKQFIKLRDKLSDVIDDNVSALNHIADPEHYGVPTANVIGIKGTDMLKVETNTISIFDGNNNELLGSIDFTNMDALKTKVSDRDYTYSEAIDIISDGVDGYQILGDLTARYSYSNRIAFSDLSNYVESFNSSSNHDIQDALFTACDEDGYISRSSFLTVLQNWMQNGKATTDDNSFAVDTSNPYGLQSVINIIVEAATLAVSVVCTILSGFLGVVAGLVGFIISGLISSISELRDVAKIQWDITSSNQYVNGPIMYADNLTYDVDVAYNGVHAQGSHVWLSESNGVAVFMWPINFKNVQAGFRANAYLYPCWKALDTLDWLRGDNAIYENSNTNQIIYAKNDKTADLWKNPYAQDLKYGDSEEPNSELEIGASLLVGWFIQQITGYAYFNDVSTTTFKSSYQTVGSGGYAEKLWMAVSRLIKGFLDNPYLTKDEFLSHNSSAINSGMDALADFIKYEIIPYRGTLKGKASDVSDAAYLYDGASATIPVLNTPIYGNRQCAGNYQRVYLNLSRDVSDYDALFIADAIPSEWGVTLPQFNATRLSYILTNMAIAATIVAIAGTKLKKAIQKKKISKLTLKADRVNTARDAYLADPTNVELRKAYENEAYRFNKLGKWFGWGSYDAANGWVNASENSNFGSLLDATASFSSQSVSLDDIINLIH